MMLAFGVSGCTTSSTSLLEGVANNSGTLALKSEPDAQTPTALASNAQTPNTQVANLQATTSQTNAPQAVAAAVPAATTGENSAALAAATNTGTVQPDVSATPATTVTAEAAVEKPQPSSLAALFGTRSSPVKPAVEAVEAAATQAQTPATTTRPVTAKSDTAKSDTAKPDTSLPSAPALDRTSQSAGAAARLFAPNKSAAQASAKQQAVMTASAGATHTDPRDYNYTLPGVRANGGLEIKHRNSVYDDSDIDADEDDFGAPLILASAGGMARLAPNGLRTQHKEVQVACLKPQLVAVLKSLERHYRKPVVVTSGFRSPSHNRKVRGAKRSLHMSCSAADIQIAGVSKWEIARHVRTLPGRGGVGTYCHTQSIHVDVGPERDWNWRCRK